MPYPLPLTRTEAYLAYKAGVIQQSDLKPSLAVPRNGIDAWLAYWTGLAADYPKREDGTPHILQEEEAYIAYLCGVINEYPEKCLRRVGAYLRYIISARWGRPDHPLNREELYLSLIKTQFIPSGDPSSDIVIDGTTKAPFVDIKLYGDTEQQSYTGKNLLNINFVSGSNHGVTITNNGDGTITAKGKTTGQVAYSIAPDTIDNLVLESGKAYTQRVEVISGTQTLRIVPSFKNSVGTVTYNYFTNNQTKTPSEQMTCTSYNIFENTTNLPVGSDVDFTIRVWLEEGSDLSSNYEPYVGGVPSPNPDYPQPIQNVTGLQTVEIVGKNLFNKDASTNGYYLDSSGAMVATTTWAVSEYMSVKEGQKYTISGTGVIGSAPKSCFYDSSKTFVSSFANGNQTITIPSGVSFMRASIFTGNASTPSDLPTYMLELGESATDYTPYHATSYPLDLGGTELCKLDTYQDYIWKDGEDWKIHKATNKIILDGTETWSNDSGTIGTNYRHNFRFAENPTIPRPKNVSAALTEPSLSDRFTNIPGSGRDTQILGSFYMSYAWAVFTDKNGIYDKSTFLAWLGATKPACYYVLDSATDTIITNQALIEQLEALKNGGAENGTTYIKVNATDPNLPGLLYVEAPKYE